VGRVEGQVVAEIHLTVPLHALHVRRSALRLLALQRGEEPLRQGLRGEVLGGDRGGGTQGGRRFVQVVGGVRRHLENE
jgi:hypothetical protein